MFTYNKERNEYISDPNRQFLIVCVISSLFTIAGIFVLYKLLFFESSPDYLFPVIYGLLFVLLWTIIAFLAAVINLIKYSKRLVINSDGVICRNFFKSKFLSWSEIKDYGLSFYDKGLYTLYFSKEVIPTKDYKTKKLKGKLIKGYISDNDYTNFVSTVIPFCVEHCDNKPFVPVILTNSLM